jgi:hypothetical protein
MAPDTAAPQAFGYRVAPSEVTLVEGISLTGWRCSAEIEGGIATPGGVEQVGDGAYSSMGRSEVSGDC